VDTGAIWTVFWMRLYPLMERLTFFSEQGSCINGQIIEICGVMGKVSPATIIAAFGAIKKD